MEDFYLSGQVLRVFLLFSVDERHHFLDVFFYLDVLFDRVLYIVTVRAPLELCVKGR